MRDVRELWNGTGWSSPEWLLAIVAMVVFGVCLGSNRTLTDHEALLAGSTKEMVLTGDWLLPRIGDQTWAEKPPLPHWLAAASALEFGRFNEWTMRFPFACAGVLVVLIVTRTMIVLFGRPVGLLAGFAQATSVYQVTYARLAEADVLLQVFVLGAIAVFVEREFPREPLTERQQSRLRLSFWVLLGLTNLVKGIGFGAALALLTCGGWLLIQRDFGAWRRWWSPVGILLAAMIGLAWPVAVVFRDPAALDLWLSHTFGRAAGDIGYTEPFWYYLTTWPVQLLPWTPLLLIAIPSSWSRIRSSARSPDAFIWWWALAQPALLSLSSGKHHHYLIYALPACSALSAQGLMVVAGWLRDEQRSLRLEKVIYPTLACLMALGGVGVSIWRPELRGEGLLVGFAGALAFALFTRALQRRDTQLACATLFSAIIAGHLYAQAAIMPRRDPSLDDKVFLANVETLVNPEVPLVASGCQEIARHIFYLNRPVIGVWNPEEIAPHLPVEHPQEEWFVIARGYARSTLERYGQVEQVTQSAHTRRERNADDRYTLFRIQPQTEMAAESGPVLR